VSDESKKGFPTAPPAALQQNVAGQRICAGHSNV
jgi:hypothetical protein